MADLPPGVTEVGRVPTGEPGGYWILGSDGGVFTENSSKFYGSYWSDFMQPHRNADRQWRAIHPTESGGYMLEATSGETYNFNPPPAPKANVPPPTTPDAVDGGVTPPAGTTASGEALVQATLDKYGLGSLGVSLLEYYRGEGAGSSDAVYLKMRESPEYKTRFPGMQARIDAGLGAISEEAYISWEGAAKNLFNQYEIPKGFYDTPEELAAFIAGDVDPTELKRRIETGYLAAMSAPPEYLDALQSQYGIGQGDLAAFFLDPTKGEAIIEQKWVAAQIGGEARKTGFGGLTTKQAEDLQAGGLTAQQAEEQFGLAEQREEAGFFQGADITKSEQVAAIGGDVKQQLEITRQGKRRTSRFEGGGGAGGFGQKGTSGLGSA